MPKHTKKKSFSPIKCSNSLIKPSKNNEIKGHHCIQHVNVHVNIDKKDDNLMHYFKCLVGLFRKGG